MTNNKGEENRSLPTREELVDALSRFSDRGVFGKREFFKLLFVLGIFGVIGYLNFLRQKDGYLFFQLMEMLDKNKEKTENKDNNQGK